MTDADRKNFARLIREHAAAVECIVMAMCNTSDQSVEQVARAILAQLAAHDPPLLIGTHDDEFCRTETARLQQNHRELHAAYQSANSEIARLRDALQALYDCQQGPPLLAPRHKAFWEASMQAARKALRGTR